MTDFTKAFDKTYFCREAYKGVDFSKFSQYWWSNRFYALLAKKHGPKQGRVLEIGCGLGDLLGWFPKQRYKVYGTDINHWAISKGRNSLPEVEFILLLAEELKAFKNSCMDIVIIKHVIEHLSEPEPVISEISRILAPGGLLILATPNLDSKMRAIKNRNWIGYRDPTHISLNTPSTWVGYIQKNNLKIKRLFSDGFWDAPYFPILPKKIQKIIFGAPGGIQAIFGWSIIPLKFGESLILLANKL
jgi:SAM-dependent methyltransferase